MLRTSRTLPLKATVIIVLLLVFIGPGAAVPPAHHQLMKARRAGIDLMRAILDDFGVRELFESTGEAPSGSVASWLSRVAAKTPQGAAQSAEKRKPVGREQNELDRAPFERFDGTPVGADGFAAATGKLLKQDIDCGQGTAVYAQPTVSCSGRAVTPAEYAGMDAKARQSCKVAGKETCICPFDGWYPVGPTCDYVRVLTCAISLAEPKPSCTPKEATKPYGEPSCYTVTGDEVIKMKLQLACLLEATPNKGEAGATYISITDGSVGDLDYFQRSFTYDALNADHTIAVRDIALLQRRLSLYLTLWNFNRLSDSVHWKRLSYNASQILGNSTVEVSVDLKSIDQSKYAVGGRFVFEAGWTQRMYGKPIIFDIRNWREPSRGSGKTAVRAVIVILILAAVAVVAFLLIRRRQIAKARSAGDSHHKDE